MTSLKKLGAKWKKDPVFKVEYDALEEEFALASALIDTRKQADMTQEDVAEKMGTRQALIARLESDRANPSLKTLRRYAAATGTKLKITFEAEPAKP